MRGFPSAPNHKERYEAQAAVLKRHTGISIVDGGSDNDDIETAERQAAAVLGANPSLRGYLCCDAAGPIGIAAAVRKAGKAGIVTVVGRYDPHDAGVDVDPDLWQASLGVTIPQRIDTGIDLITPENVDSFLGATRVLDLTSSRSSTTD